MVEAKACAACAVFDGKVVVSGGLDGNRTALNTAQCYDVVADEWSSMPGMVEGKSNHALVAVKNKLFVIGCRMSNCEVYDKACNSFVLLRSPMKNHAGFKNALSVDNKILILKNRKDFLVCYDIDKDVWTEKPCQATKHVWNFSSAKVPWF